MATQEYVPGYGASSPNGRTSPTMRSRPSATAATSSRSSLECAAAREAPTFPPRCGPPGYSRSATGSSSASSATAIPQTRSRLWRRLRLRRLQAERGVPPRVRSSVRSFHPLITRLMVSARSHCCFRVKAIALDAHFPRRNPGVRAKKNRGNRGVTRGCPGCSHVSPEQRDPIDRLTDLAPLRQSGAITHEEFEAQKARLLRD
jgi:hypothetical protein